MESHSRPGVITLQFDPVLSAFLRKPADFRSWSRGSLGPASRQSLSLRTERQEGSPRVPHFANPGAKDRAVFCSQTLARLPRGCEKRSMLALRKYALPGCGLAQKGSVAKLWSSASFRRWVTEA